ncbi:CinA family protein [Robiginitomaculum antarcticum]|uniref:CinA family protein n=1 Tax=Robiginitomaculum antarcticum TaxID=437507 RepID=UPI0003730881|nr:CinA family protein [Robiginitomaculum antarcticum]
MNPILEDISDQAAAVLEKANAAGIKIGTAESCTGGLIGAALTAIPGSSRAFRGSIVAYDNSVKMKLLGVLASTLRDHGAVSAQTAEAMATGVVKALSLDVAVSVTGVAGPGGGTRAKPVGTVWIGIAKHVGDDVSATAHLYEFGDIGRNKVRDLTCLAALKTLNEAL